MNIVNHNCLPSILCLRANKFLHYQGNFPRNNGCFSSCQWLLKHVGGQLVSIIHYRYNIIKYAEEDEQDNNLQVECNALE